MIDAAEREGLITEKMSPLSITHEHVPMLLRTTANMVATTGAKAVQKTHGFGVNDGRVLAAIGVDPGVRATELADPLDLDKAALSRSVALLIDQGWVGVVQPSARLRHLFLTEAGQQVFVELTPFAFQRQELLLSGLSEDERAVLVKLLYRLLENETLLQEHLESLAPAQSLTESS